MTLIEVLALLTFVLAVVDLCHRIFSDKDKEQ